MITAIEIENFKGIGERTRVEIKPITLLFGPNSVGKSTILHAMQLAREILTRGNVNADKIAGSSIDLGGFRQYVHNHDVTKTVRLRFELDMGSEDLLTAFPVPEYLLKNPHLADEDKEDVSSIGDEVFDAWIEIEIEAELITEWAQYGKYSVTEPNSAIVSTLTVGLNGEPFARMTIQPNRGITHLNLRHRLFAWDRIADDSIGRLDALWPNTRPMVEWLYFSGTSVELRELANPPERMIVCKAPFAQSEDESQWHFRAALQFLDFDGMDVAAEQICAASPDGRYVRRWGVRYLAEHASLAAGEKYVKTCFPTPWFSTDKSDFCRSGMREVEDWALLDGRLVSTGKVSHPLNLLAPLVLLQPLESSWEFDDSETRAERFGVYSALLNRLIQGPIATLHRELGQFRHVGPIRQPVPRNHEPRRFLEASDWLEGLAAWDELTKDALLTMRVNRWVAEKDRLDTGYSLTRYYYRKAPMHFRSIVEYENEDEDRSSVPSILDVEKTNSAWNEMPVARQMRLQKNGEAVWLEPADLGQGITQMIPVVTSALMPREPGEKRLGTLVAIEQPELHVHPRQQAAMGDVFISGIGDPGNRFLIETHSEHLMLRLLRRIRETAEGREPEPKYSIRFPEKKLSLKPDDISVLYVQSRSEIEPGQSGIVIHKLRVDEEGDFLDSFPNGFFPERLRELR